MSKSLSLLSSDFSEGCPIAAIACNATAKMPYRVEWFNSVEEIPAESWDLVAPEGHVYFSRKYLSAMEAAPQPELNWHYLVIFKGMEPVLISAIQEVAVNVQRMIDGEAVQQGTISRVGTKILSLGVGKQIRLLVCGNLVVPSFSGHYAREGYADEELMPILSAALKRLRREIGAERTIDATLFKEFSLPTHPQVVPLKENGYNPLAVEPNMILDLAPEWKNFQDYLSAMTSKWRTKAKSAIKKSKNLEVRELMADEIEQNLDQIRPLYDSVVAKADFSMLNLNLEAYVSLKRNFPEKFTFRSYWLEGQCVGFMTACKSADGLDAHFVGIDYDHNRQHAIYPRILCDYVKLGLELGCRYINFGKTSNEIKSTMGAEPEPLYCLARHRNPVSNHVLQSIFKRVSPKAWEQRKPFKAEYYESRENNPS